MSTKALYETKQLYHIEDESIQDNVDNIWAKYNVDKSGVINKD